MKTLLLLYLVLPCFAASSLSIIGGGRWLEDPDARSTSAKNQWLTGLQADYLFQMDERLSIGPVIGHAFSREFSETGYLSLSEATLGFRSQIGKDVVLTSFEIGPSWMYAKAKDGALSLSDKQFGAYAQMNVTFKAKSVLLGMGLRYSTAQTDLDNISSDGFSAFVSLGTVLF